jgi:mannosyl-3-phosphoglycerate synthase
MEIETLYLPQLLEADRLTELDFFVRRTAFVVCHKAEPLDTLLAVLRYLPAESSVIVVTNCPNDQRAALSQALAAHLVDRPAAYLVHQKDARVAQFFRHCGVSRLLGADGLVRDGKGEGMYIGALLAVLLRTPEWLIYYDADNHAPSALLEYTLAMSRLFMSERTVLLSTHDHSAYSPALPPHCARHIVRVGWASKPIYDGQEFIPQPGSMGRCTRVIAPLCDALLRAQWPGTDQALTTSNAGEQGMTMETVRTLCFSSGYSIETFQLLQLMLTSGGRLQQYMSDSPHFHQKKDEAHIHSMIAASLGCFLALRRRLPPEMLVRLEEVCAAAQVRPVLPIIYPALRSLPLEGHEDLAEQFRLGVAQEAWYACSAFP